MNRPRETTARRQLAGVKPIGPPRYTLVRCPSSYCPTCHRTVVLLSSDRVGTACFFICWHCSTIYQAGHAGPIAEASGP